MKKSINYEPANSATIMKNGELDYDNLVYVPSLVLDDKYQYDEKVDDQIDIKGTHNQLKQHRPQQRLKTQPFQYLQSRRQIKDHDQSLSIVGIKKSLNKLKNKIHKQNSQHSQTISSQKSFKSTSTQQIKQKYQISSIMKRIQQQKQQKSNKRWFVFKIVLLVLFFPFSLIFLFVYWIVDKCKSKNIKQQSQIIAVPNPQSQRLSQQLAFGKKHKNYIKKQKINYKKHKTCWYKCNRFVQKHVFYYLFFQCIDDCKLFKKTCNCTQHCCQFLCENKCMECCQNFCYCCCVKGCQKFWGCICCRCCWDRPRKVDTLQRLQKQKRRKYLEENR